MRFHYRGMLASGEFVLIPREDGVPFPHVVVSRMGDDLGLIVTAEGGTAWRHAFELAHMEAYTAEGPQTLLSARRQGHWYEICVVHQES